MIDQGRGVGQRKNGVYLDFSSSLARLGRSVIEERYGNLFEIYNRITDEDPYLTPMRIYPAPHYAMGGLWVDYNLMTTIPGLYAIGEANFSDHGANRLGASALMQGLADGYFVLPYTIGDYLTGLLGTSVVPTDDAAFKQVKQEVADTVGRYVAARGTRSPDWFHRQLGKIMWDYCGMSRDAAGLEKALSEIPALYEEFRMDVRVPGTGEHLNQTLEKAGRVEDFFQLATLICRDALDREESCGGHFREEHQLEDGEAKRNDEEFSYVAAWEWTGTDPALHKEPLTFEHAHPSTRSYK
jgi:succinate dehydrogenase / fumarate reductase flavoprotein subunit